MSIEQDEVLNRIVSILRSDWDAIAGILSALAAIVLHFLHLLDGDILLTISTVLVAALFVRELRSERPAEQAHASIRDIRMTVESISSDTTTLRGDILDLLRLQKGVRVHIYPSRSEVYTAIANILIRAMDATGEKHLDLAALHGHSGDRLTDEQNVEREFTLFNTAMLQCIQQPGNAWRVRHIYNISTKERLQIVEQRLNLTCGADGFEVRAFCSPESIPHLAPLVAVSDEVFIGIEDPRYYRIHKAIHIKSHQVADVVTEYFNSLWSRPGIFILRSADRVRQEEIERLREQIDGLPRSGT